jgi:hypothetical protein
LICRDDSDGDHAFGKRREALEGAGARVISVPMTQGTFFSAYWSILTKGLLNPYLDLPVTQEGSI